MSAETLTLGVVPQQAATKLLRDWVPLLQVVEQQAGVKIRFATAPSIPVFEERVAAGEYDIVYMNPYHFTVFNDDPGYTAIAKAERSAITGIMVVRQDSRYESLKDLTNTTLAFPAPKAFAATLLTQANLNKENIPFEPKYVGSHDAVYRGVAAGLFPAGGGINRTLNTLEPEVRDQLRVLWTSPGYTPHAIAAHPDLAADLRQRIQDALISVKHSPDADRVLNPLGISGFMSAECADWDDVRALAINPY
ncbi:phosphate/phosphite/phosphonate ABC transporter substrate-binding protein [Reinekea marinisedimentorum]|uniref:phosphate/phosphite/phosphonate ABC transporter substrate-binding protein n=1 Tax=Reinekea marinisedimentorum TaxID=230495 RepID=UPI001FB2E3A6|nr:phosphate/phosphite/phosphonate ABC transporter substrate-binding protein [Reinekea marinisedimentorum]